MKLFINIVAINFLHLFNVFRFCSVVRPLVLLITNLCVVSSPVNTAAQKLDVVKFIQGDLERLYMNGMEEDEEYFQQPDRTRVLLNVLFVWAEEHPHTSGYRQGMHEIAAPLLLALEAETALWRSAMLGRDNDQTLHEVDTANTNHSGPNSAVGSTYFSDEKYVESSLYWLFSTLMQDLDYLYMPPAQPRELPGVVQFCSQVQDEMLRALDPALCVHLEDNYVQAQLYGMRWSRLLLGREFAAAEDSLFRIWDYIFASALQIPHPEGDTSGSRQESVARTSQESLASSSSPDPLFNTPVKGGVQEAVQEEWPTSSAAMKARRKIQFDKPSLILESLADFMLAMLLHIRDDLLSGDNSTTLSLLMRYPAVHDITPIIDLADMIRRGVLDSNSHVGAGACTSSGDEHEVAQETISSGGGGKSSHTPSWLWKESSSSTEHGNDATFSIRKNLQGVTKQLGQKLSSVVSTSVLAEKDTAADGTSAAPRRKTSLGTRNSLFGITGRRGSKDSKESKASSLFDDSPLADVDSTLRGGESMVALEKHIVEEGKSSVLVIQELIRLAAFLDNWTNDKSRSEPATVMPGVVSRLRQLSGLLDQSLMLADYSSMQDNIDDENVDNGCRNVGDGHNALIDINKDGSEDEDVSILESDRRSAATNESQRQGVPEEEEEEEERAIKTTSIPAPASQDDVSPPAISQGMGKNKEDDIVFGKDFFASIGLKTEEKVESKRDDTSTDLLKSLVGTDKSKRDESKIDAIFSDLTGDKKTNISTASPFDDPF